MLSTSTSTMLAGSQDHAIHTKDRMTRLQMETTMAVLGDRRCYRTARYRTRTQGVDRYSYS